MSQDLKRLKTSTSEDDDDTSPIVENEYFSDEYQSESSYDYEQDTPFQMDDIWWNNREIIRPPPPPRKVRKNLAAVAKQMRLLGEASGSYCSHGECPELSPMIGLEVANFGPLSLPLNECQATRLMNVCQPAPFGKDDQTLIDRAVRDSFQLEPSQVTITNPKWDEQFDKLVERVKIELGIKPQNCIITAELYKVLVYGPGGHFVKHKDTEKKKNMFGTLVIQPPSLHTGGELVVYSPDGEENCVADFGKSTERRHFGIHYAAHYADLDHELREVTSGYRLVLVYSLCWKTSFSWAKSDPPKTFEFDKNQEAKLDKLVSTFRALNSSPYSLGLLLEHQYTPQAFENQGVVALKRADFHRFRILNEVNRRLPADEKLDLYIYQVHVNKSIQVQARMHRISWNVAILHASEGSPLFKSLEFQLENFSRIYKIGKRSVTKFDVRDQDAWGRFIVKKGGYMGNEPTDYTKVYSKYLFLMWPRRFRIEVFTKFDIHTAIEMLDKQQGGVFDELTRRQVVGVIEALDFHENKNSKVECTEVGKLLELASQLDVADLESVKMLLRKLIETNVNKPPGLYDKAMAHLAKLIAKFGNENLKSLIKSNIENYFVLVCHLALHLSQNNLAQDGLEYVNECILEKVRKPEFSFDIYSIKVEASSLIEMNSKNCVPGLQTVVDTFRERMTRVNKSNRSSDLIKAFSSSYQLSKYPKAIEFVKSVLQTKRNQLEHLEANFSWSMPQAKLSEYPQVEEFLRSEQQTMVYACDSVNQLECLVEHLKDQKQDFSVETKRLPSSISIQIDKTRADYEMRIESLKTSLRYFRDIDKNNEDQTEDGDDDEDGSESQNSD